MGTAILVFGVISFTVFLLAMIYSIFAKNGPIKSTNEAYTPPMSASKAKRLAKKQLNNSISNVKNKTKNHSSAKIAANN